MRVGDTGARPIVGSAIAGSVVWHVRAEFSLTLPRGSGQLTPTMEAIESAALALAGPIHEILPGSSLRVSRRRVSRRSSYLPIWVSLLAIEGEAGFGERARLYRVLTKAGIRTRTQLRRRPLVQLRQVPGIGVQSMRVLARSGLLGPVVASEVLRSMGSLRARPVGRSPTRRVRHPGPGGGR